MVAIFYKVSIILCHFWKYDSPSNCYYMYAVLSNSRIQVLWKWKKERTTDEQKNRGTENQVAANNRDTVKARSNWGQLKKEVNGETIEWSSKC